MGEVENMFILQTIFSLLVLVAFCYREERDYTAQYTISGVLGEDPLTITVDEKHEDMLNLVIDPLTSDS